MAPRMRGRFEGFPRVAGAIAAVAAGPCASAQPWAFDPWPMDGRTANRQANCPWAGPKTPTIAWSVRTDPSNLDRLLYLANPTIDREGRVFVQQLNGLTCVDSRTGTILWTYEREGSGARTLSISEGIGTYADTSALNFLHGFDLETGQHRWIHQGVRARPGAVGDDGLLYLALSQPQVVQARRFSDGAVVSEGPNPGGTGLAPSLDGRGRLVCDSDPNIEARCYSIADWSRLWTYKANRDIPRLCVIADGPGAPRVYLTDFNFGTEGGAVYCLDLETGAEIWRFRTGDSTQVPVAVGPDGTVYAARSNRGAIFALDPVDGRLIWRYDTIGSGVFAQPVVDGDGTIYATVYQTGTPDRGWVHAINPDGSTLWEIEMPDRVNVSPAIAPNGAMFIHVGGNDKRLYCFKDPCAADCDGNGRLDIRDFFCFQALFAQRDGRADCDTSGTWDIRDFFCFQRAFAEGCP